MTKIIGGFNIKQKKIFIVEDNAKNMALFKAVLDSLPNLEVLTAKDGKEGLELIKSDQPDIIILDIQLPDIHGTEICKELRKIDQFKNTPIFAVTSFAMKGDEDRILEAGFNKYISKPINVKDFREMIQNLIK